MAWLRSFHCRRLGRGDLTPLQLRVDSAGSLEGVIRSCHISTRFPYMGCSFNGGVFCVCVAISRDLARGRCAHEVGDVGTRVLNGCRIR